MIEFDFPPLGPTGEGDCKRCEGGSGKLCDDCEAQDAYDEDYPPADCYEDE